MRNIYEKILQFLRQAQRSVLCTVIDTRGSTPQGAGCKMLVLPNAQTIGTIGGGCVEAEVRRRALQVLENRRAETLQFVLDHDYGWDDGLICGGRMDVFVEVLDLPDAASVYAGLIREMDERRRVVLGTNLDAREDSAPDRHFLCLLGSGQVVGPGSPPEAGAVLEAAQAAAREGRPALFPTRSPEGREQKRLFLEPVLPKPVLLIAGAGHVGQALAHLGVLLDFEVAVVDDRASCASRERFPDTHRLIVEDIPRALEDFPVGEDTYVVIVTRGHLHDQEALYRVIRRPAAYVGLIGSRRKIRLIFNEFHRLGVPESLMRRVFAPVGLDIGSQSVQEIALSIAAQLVLARSRMRNGGDPAAEQAVQALRDRSKAIDHAMPVADSRT
ncbi:MAG: XdhC family protein [Planctomycetes bacterium]|nr:XdhC family protein [Planctomycetota bacterium]